MTDTPNTTQGKGAVDWGRPIEAVHTDGTVHPVTNGGKSITNGCYWLTMAGRGYWVASSWPYIAGGWSFRNVEDRTDTGTLEHPAPTQYAPELVERMVTLLRKQVAKLVNLHDDDVTVDVIEARSIVSDLPQEVDPDLIEARERLNLSFVPRTDEAEALALACIKRGRQLERGDAA